MYFSLYAFSIHNASRRTVTLKLTQCLTNEKQGCFTYAFFQCLAYTVTLSARILVLLNYRYLYRVIKNDCQGFNNS